MVGKKIRVANLVRLSIVLNTMAFYCVKHHDQKHRGEETVYFSLDVPFIVHYERASGYKEKIETWRQEPKQNPWRSTAHRLAPQT